MDNQLHHIYRHFPRCEVIYVVGFQCEKFGNCSYPNVKFVVNEEHETTNVVASYNLGLGAATYEDIVIVHGDLAFNSYALKAPFGSYSLVILDDKGDMGKDEVGCVVSQNQVSQIMYQLPRKWAQIAGFMGKELSLLHEFCNDPLNKRKFGFEAINYIIDNGGEFVASSNKRTKVTDIDTSMDIRTAKKMLI